MVLGFSCSHESKKLYQEGSAQKPARNYGDGAALSNFQMDIYQVLWAFYSLVKL